MSSKLSDDTKLLGLGEINCPNSFGIGPKEIERSIQETQKLLKEQ